MKHFLIYTNALKDKNFEVTNRIKQFLETKGMEVTVKTEEGPVDQPADICIVLGGDGTVLQAARDTRELEMPLIGVNMGTLGYMTEIEVVNLEESLERLVSGDYDEESRMMLAGDVNKKDDSTLKGWALNDIVISRKGSLQMINFKIYVNGQFLHEYEADGMIVTTATGSTGYNLSAGGPIVEPKAKLIVLTPICPHTLNQRSVILSPDDVVEITIPVGRYGKEQVVEASFDGFQREELTTGESITIFQSKRDTKFLSLNRVSFLEVLKNKF